MPDTTPSENKGRIRSLYEDCLNNRRLDRLEDFIADAYVGMRGETGPAGFEATVRSVIDAFPDIRWTVEDLVAEGDRVVVRWSWVGTHEGMFRGFLPPTGERVEDHAIAIYRMEGGKAVQAWIRSDRLGFLQQLGRVPTDLTQLADAGD